MSTVLHSSAADVGLTFLTHWKRRLAYAAPVVVLAAVIAWVTITHPYVSGAHIRSDGVGYHAWTKAILHGDLSFCSWRNDGSGFISYVDEQRQVCQNKYPPGLAFIQLPFMAFVVDRHAPINEISNQENGVSVVLGALAFLVTIGLLAWAAAMLRVSSWKAALAIAVTSFGTGLFHYGTYDSCFTHVYSAMFCCLAAVFAIRDQRLRRPFPVGIALACGFFMVSLRNTNVFIVVCLALGWLFYARDRPLFARLRPPVAMMSGVAIAVAIQISYNYYVQRMFTLSSYGQESFMFDRPMQGAVLFSYERGLLTYYPLFAVALIGGAMTRQTRPLTLLLLLLVATLTNVYGYWHSWMLGGGMGHRGFIEITPIAALVLMTTWQRFGRIATGTSVVASMLTTLVTLQVMVGYWRGTYPFGGASQTDYWSHVRWFGERLAGSNSCDLPRCEDAFGACIPAEVPDGTLCLLDWGHHGYCMQGLGCEAVVTLRVVDSSRSYVTAPLNGKWPQPLIASAKIVGDWERFILMKSADDQRHVYLRALSNRRFVTVRVAPNRRPLLLARGKSAADAEMFTREGTTTRARLRTTQGQYVSLVAKGDAHEGTLTLTDSLDGAAQFVLAPSR